MLPEARPSPVYLLIGQLGLGGAEKQVVLLADGLRRRGVDARVLVMFGGGERTAELRAAGVPVVDLAFRRRPVGVGMVWANLLAYTKMIFLLRRDRPAVLHAFLFHSYVAAAPAAWLARVPVLVAGRRSLSVTRGRPVMRIVERIATRMTQHLVANAEAVAADARDHERVPAGKVSVVYNALPESAFAPAPAATVDTGRPVVLCVANLRECKGHRYLLDAAALLRARGRAVTLVLAGDGPLRTALERQAADLGVDARFLGRRTDVPALLARADVVVSASLAEGLSNTVMEAMAAGRPVIGTDVGGTGELLRDRGILVPPADPGALADALEVLLADAGTGTRLAASARAWIERNSSLDAMVDRHLELYGRLACAA
jgi:glycosyltransferase involved in cell wall biosynthesis